MNRNQFEISTDTRRADIINYIINHQGCTRADLERGLKNKMSKIDQTIEGRQRINQRKVMKFWLLIAFFILIVMVLSTVFGDKGLLEVNQLKKSCATISLEVEILKRENERLSQEIYALKNDPYYIEAMARRELGLVKPDEIVYQFLPKSKED